MSRIGMIEMSGAGSPLVIIVNWCNFSRHPVWVHLYRWFLPNWHLICTFLDLRSQSFIRALILNTHH